jgi:PH domain
MEGYQTLSSQNLRSQDIIELKKFPQQLNLCLSDGSDQWVTSFMPTNTDSMHVIKFDWTDPLLEVLPTADRLFKLRKGEHYTFQVMRFQHSKKSVQWLNANLSLEEQDVPVDGFVVVVPISSLSKRNAESQLSPTVDGFLQKLSIKEGKSTALKKRFCVLTDNFLYYYKQQSGSPSGVVPLEYYNVLRNDDGGRCSFLLEYAKGSGMLAKAPTYVMTAENARERETWVAAIRRICFSGAGKNVFGVPLTKLLARKDQKLEVPILVRDALTYLDKPEIHTLEGIFRISGSASMISNYKQDYDTGKVCGLLVFVGVFCALLYIVVRCCALLCVAVHCCGVLWCSLVLTSSEHHAHTLFAFVPSFYALLSLTRCGSCTGVLRASFPPSFLFFWIFHRLWI